MTAHDSAGQIPVGRVASMQMDENGDLYQHDPGIAASGAGAYPDVVDIINQQEHDVLCSEEITSYDKYGQTRRFLRSVGGVSTALPGGTDAELQAQNLLDRPITGTGEIGGVRLYQGSSRFFDQQGELHPGVLRVEHRRQKSGGRRERHGASGQSTHANASATGTNVVSSGSVVVSADGIGAQSMQPSSSNSSTMQSTKDVHSPTRHSSITIRKLDPVATKKHGAYTNLEDNVLKGQSHCPNNTTPQVNSGQSSRRRSEASSCSVQGGSSYQTSSSSHREQLPQRGKRELAHIKEQISPREEMHATDDASRTNLRQQNGRVLNSGRRARNSLLGRPAGQQRDSQHAGSAITIDPGTTRGSSDISISQQSIGDHKLIKPSGPGRGQSIDPEEPSVPESFRQGDSRTSSVNDADPHLEGSVDEHSMSMESSAFCNRSTFSSQAMADESDESETSSDEEESSESPLRSNFSGQMTGRHVPQNSNSNSSHGEDGVHMQHEAVFPSSIDQINRMHFVANINGETANDPTQERPLATNSMKQGGDMFAGLSHQHRSSESTMGQGLQPLTNQRLSQIPAPKLGTFSLMKTPPSAEMFMQFQASLANVQVPSRIGISQVSRRNVQPLCSAAQPVILGSRVTFNSPPSQTSTHLTGEGSMNGASTSEGFSINFDDAIHQSIPSDAPIPAMELAPGSMSSGMNNSSSAGNNVVHPAYDLRKQISDVMPRGGGVRIVTPFDRNHEAIHVSQKSSGSRGNSDSVVNLHIREPQTDVSKGVSTDRMTAPLSHAHQRATGADPPSGSANSKGNCNTNFSTDAPYPHGNTVNYVNNIQAATQYNIQQNINISYQYCIQQRAPTSVHTNSAWPLGRTSVAGPVSNNVSGVPNMMPSAANFASGQNDFVSGNFNLRGVGPQLHQHMHLQKAGSYQNDASGGLSNVPDDAAAQPHSVSESSEEGSYGMQVSSNPTSSKGSEDDSAVCASEESQQMPDRQQAHGSRSMVEPPKNNIVPSSEPAGLIPTGRKKIASSEAITRAVPQKKSSVLWDSDDDETVTTKIKKHSNESGEVPAFLQHFRGKHTKNDTIKEE